MEYTLAQPGEVSLAIYDVAGRRVASLGASRARGRSAPRLVPLQHMAHGIYFVRMRAGGISYTRRMLVLRRAN